MVQFDIGNHDNISALTTLNMRRNVNIYKIKSLFLLLLLSCLISWLVTFTDNELCCELASFVSTHTLEQDKASVHHFIALR